jgi:hypothetical protein
LGGVDDRLLGRHAGALADVNKLHPLHIDRAAGGAAADVEAHARIGEHAGQADAERGHRVGWAGRLAGQSGIDAAIIHARSNSG